MLFIVKKIVNFFRFMGIDIVKFIRFWIGIPSVFRDYLRLKKQIAAGNINIKISLNKPCPDEKFASASAETGHYFSQDLLVAEKIAAKSPERHVDIGSSVYGFVSHVAAFRNIEIFDIRPLETEAFSQIKFIQCDMMEPLDSKLKNYSDSVSCLHALEHFGLGRYGDPVNINGSVQGFHNLADIVKPGGTLYVSVPIGSEHIEFNAHRIFAIRSVIDMGENENLILREFSFIDDSGKLHPNVELTEEVINGNASCFFGCGIFEFIKK